jgi:hypothetical protein
MSDGEVKMNEVVLPESQLVAPTMVAEHKVCILDIEPWDVHLLGAVTSSQIYEKSEKTEWIRTRNDMLSPTEERGLTVTCHGALYPVNEAHC